MGDEQKIKCFEISPSGDSRFDTLIIKSDDTWRNAIDFLEQSLESQFLNDTEWDEISCTVKCVYKTQSELDELEVE
jgi:hypothetical protein